MSGQPKFLSELEGSAADRAAAVAMVRATPAAIVPEPFAPPHTGRIFRHTKSNDPILGTNKITYAHFVKSVWCLTNTNLHFKDFEAEFADELKRMFYPVQIKNGSQA